MSNYNSSTRRRYRGSQRVYPPSSNRGGYVHDLYGQPLAPPPTQWPPRHNDNATDAANHLSSFSSQQEPPPQRQQDESSGGEPASSRAPNGYYPETRPIEELMEEKLKFHLYDADEIFLCAGQFNMGDSMETWEGAKLNPDLLKNIHACKYLAPRGIQKAVIPALRQGFDVILNSESGSGKTLTYLVPIIAGIMESNGGQQPLFPVAVIVVPTFDLGEQIFEETRRLIQGTKVSAARAFGKTDYRMNVNELATGCDIVIGTPGRLIHLIQDNNVRLHRLRYLVLDECDLLLERRKMNEHSSSLYEQIRTIYDNANENAQIIMVSATLEDAVGSKCLELVKKDHFAHFKTASSAPNKRVELRFIAKKTKSIKI